MSFLLRNLQRSVKINTVLFEYHVNLIRKIMRVNSYDMAVICFEDDKVQNLNGEYRGIDEPTDVLAFPFLDITHPGEIPDIDNPEERILGDIVLGLPYIHKDCKTNSQKIEEVLPIMVTHGICHLIGYDHEDEKQWDLMYKKELEILQKFNTEAGLSCKPLLGIGH